MTATPNILDLLNAKLNVVTANVRATDEKVGLETTTREGELAAARARIAVLEHDRDTQGTEVIHKQTLIDALDARLSALEANLVALGVTS